ncbi:MAG: hypothetical protein FJX77_06005 [Armatimonadetes bacterium]|nr:hypothetical protein [Armatimonadota bacterium]
MEHRAIHDRFQMPDPLRVPLPQQEAAQDVAGAVRLGKLGNERPKQGEPNSFPPELGGQHRQHLSLLLLQGPGCSGAFQLRQGLLPGLD